MSCEDRNGESSEEKYSLAISLQKNFNYFPKLILYFIEKGQRQKFRSIFH